MQILHAIAVRPPQIRPPNVQLCVVFRRERHRNTAARRHLNLAFKHHSLHASGHQFPVRTEVNLLFQVDGPAQNASPNGRPCVAKFGRNGDESIRRVGQLQVGDHVRVLYLHVVRVGKVNILIHSHVAIAHDGRAIPAGHELQRNVSEYLGTLSASLSERFEEVTRRRCAHIVYLIDFHGHRVLSVS